jgi:hypothetical protein
MKKQTLTMEKLEATSTLKSPAGVSNKKAQLRTVGFG